MWLKDWPITAWTWAERARRPCAAPPDPAGPLAPVAADPARDAAFVPTERGPRGVVLCGLNPAARALGLRLGQAHADACAVEPALRSHPAEPGQALQALHRLALWAQRYAPLVAVDPAEPGLEGLWLDVTGAEHLFGGEAALLNDLVARLARAGASAQVGMAGTPGAAFALARFAPSAHTRAPPGGEARALAPLPVEALRLSPAAVQLLGRFGLRRIGDLYPLPRAALARRFRGEAGMQAVRRLDQALGRVAEPLVGETAPTAYLAHRVFAEPILHAEGVARWGAVLAETLGAKLEQRGLGARRLVLTGFRADGDVTGFSVALGRASRDPLHMIRLLRETGWERLDVGFGLDALRLSAPVTEPLSPSQSDGLAATGIADRERARAALIDRLTARLGETAILRPAFRESWRPERAERLAPFGAGDPPSLPQATLPPAALPQAAALQPAPTASSTARPPPLAAPRPILLFAPPEPMEAVAELPDGAPARFTWRRVSRRVARASGPERLAPEWWRGAASPVRPARTRDYYRIEDEAGGRYWVFREGLYDAPEAASAGPEAQDAPQPPSWWMHGLFA